MVLARQELFTGKPVYKGGATAPNRGTVDPKGYLRRELEKRGVIKAKAAGPSSFQQGVSRVGRDGQSDTRSGLAANMLQNISQPASAPVIDRTKMGMQSSPLSAPNNGEQAKNPVFQPEATSTPIAQLPTVQITPVGTLQLPMEEAGNYEAIQQQMQMQQALQQMQLDMQQQQLAYQQSLQEGAQAYADQKRNRLSDSAGRGVAFSSGHGYAVGRDAQSYNDAMNKLNQDHNNKINQYNLGVGGIQGQFNAFMQHLAIQRAQKAAEQAAALAAAQAAAAAAAPPPPPVSMGNDIEVGNLPGSKKKKKKKNKGKNSKKKKNKGKNSKNYRFQGWGGWA